MRFRFKYLFMLLLFCFACHSYAGQDSPVLPVDTIAPSTSDITPKGATVIDADSLTGKKEDQVEATGDVTLRQDGQSVRANNLQYNQITREVDAHGAVVLEQDGNKISGPHLQFNMNTNVGAMQQPQYHLKENDARGSADVLHIQDRMHYSLESATYTTCPAGNDDWLMKMGLLEIDRDRQVGVAHNALVDFKGVPILYTPWMDFPLNGQRKSGLMAPIIGGTVSGGSEVTLPFYWNIAPNFDATIAPRQMDKRGLLLNNEFRYLEPTFSGEMHADVLPADAITKQSRSLFSLKHNHSLANRFSGYVDYTHVSDDAYFRDLGNVINVTSQANLLEEEGVNYNADWWTAMARVQHYQTLQDPAAPLVEPYSRFPQLTFNARQNYADASANVDGEYVSFSHPVLLNARRMVLNPSVSYPLVNNPAFYVTPKVALHSANYVMGDNNTGGLPNTSLTVPLFSVDSGVTFEREGNLFNNDYVQTLEPRAFYVYVPYKDQTLVPNFDSALADFSFTQMFSENRFVGNDLVGDANNLTLALTSRLLEQENGMEHLKVMIGERISFRTPQVSQVAPAATTSIVTPATTTNLPPPESTNNKSDILLGLTGRVTKRMTLDSEFQFDPNQSHVQRYNITTSYRPEAGKVLNLGYRFTRNTLRQSDVSFQWPLFRRWHAVGRWNYSIQDSRMIETTGGLEYNQDCWMLRLVAQRFATAAQAFNTGFFLQLELNDFVKVGADPLLMLKQSVPGYTQLNDKASMQPAQVLH
jgi:LPS-assembly protein